MTDEKKKSYLRVDHLIFLGGVAGGICLREKNPGFGYARKKWFKRGFKNNLASKISEQNLALSHNLVKKKNLQMFSFELSFQNVAGFLGLCSHRPPLIYKFVFICTTFVHQKAHIHTFNQEIGYYSLI